jgi:hypothetical protein
MISQGKRDQFEAAKASVVGALGAIAERARVIPSVTVDIASKSCAPLVDARAEFEREGFAKAGAFLEEICVEIRGLVDEAHAEVWFGRDGDLEGLDAGSPEREEILQRQHRLFCSVYSSWLARDRVKWLAELEQIDVPRG